MLLHIVSQKLAASFLTPVFGLLFGVVPLLVIALHGFFLGMVNVDVGGLEGSVDHHPSRCPRDTYAPQRGVIPPMDCSEFATMSPRERVRADWKPGELFHSSFLLHRLSTPRPRGGNCDSTHLYAAGNCDHAGYTIEVMLLKCRRDGSRKSVASVDAGLDIPDVRFGFW